ncbi:MAG: hypothetical protein JWN52_3460 [Actinomycetia bacterium]|nr:hypothetical protein [Actinomycetes bacterium]
MTETPEQPQDDDPREAEERTQPAEASHERQDDQPEPLDGPQGDPLAPPAGPQDDRLVPSGGLPQPPPYRGVYGQQPGAAPQSYGQQAYGAPQPGQQHAYGAPPYDPAYGPYDPRWGYGPPGNPQYPQHGQPTGDDTTMALFCYVGALLGGFIVPLILYLIKKDQSRFVRFHAAQALNYALTQMIVLLAVIIPLIVAAIALRQPAVAVLIAPVWLYELISPYVWMILGAIRSNRGEWYTLPKWTCFRMVR